MRDWVSWVNLALGALVLLWLAAAIVQMLVHLGLATPQAVRGFWLRLGRTRRTRVVFALALVAWLSLGAWAWAGAVSSTLEAGRTSGENADNVQRACLELLR